MTHSIHRLFNIRYTSNSLSEILIFHIDAEKAFDRIKGDYLFSALSRFGFGSKYISWIKPLYASPMASVQTNKIRSEYFSLTRSTRQGCPLSLLLFALAIEPLAVSLRDSKEYSGIHRGGKKHKAKSLDTPSYSNE